MNMKNISLAFALMLAGALVSSARAQQNKPLPPPLTEAGQRLETRYAAQLQALKAEIEAALPRLDPAKKAAFTAAHKAIKEAKAGLKKAEEELGKIGGAEALVGHAKNKWLPEAERGIAAAEAALKKANTEAERETARKELAKWQANKAEGLKALQERQTALEKIKAEEPKLRRNVEAAKQALATAQERMSQAVRELALDSFLGRDALDARLVKCAVLTEATPRGLAEFAQQGAAQEALIEKLLNDPSLMKEMLVADGASGGRYGRAMEIYTAIQNASSRAREGVLRRLALAISLVHAEPVAVREGEKQTASPKYVDPVRRYLHFEKAFLAGELDPAFKSLTAWELRWVVDGDEPDEILAWGREMLRTYRPDHIRTSDEKWRYVSLVRTDVPYGSQDVKYDRPELGFYQNILLNGGICGRRAFIGRFILRAFGVPTTARPQPGHGALVRWTSEGWAPCLGAGWGSGWTKTRYDRDVDFLATTQARQNPEAHLMVQRAQWIGTVLGEKPVYGLESGDPDFWHGAALYIQQGIIANLNAKTLDAVGKDIAEASDSKEKIDVQAVEIAEADRKVMVRPDGVIVIPAAATSRPTKSTGKILFMPSYSGGMQLHYNRQGKPETFEYVVEAPAAGRYALRAKVAVPSWGQQLFVSVNGAPEPVKMDLPLTVGLWQTTPPVEITLAAGRNVLLFSRGHERERGLTIKEFTLTPIQ